MDPKHIAKFIEDVGPGKMGINEALDIGSFGEVVDDFNEKIKRRASKFDAKLRKKYPAYIPGTIKYDVKHRRYTGDIKCNVCNQVKTYYTADIAFYKGFPSPENIPDDDDDDILPDEDVFGRQEEIYGCWDCRKKSKKR